MQPDAMPFAPLTTIPLGGVVDREGPGAVEVAELFCREAVAVVGAL